MRYGHAILLIHSIIKGLLCKGKGRPMDALFSLWGIMLWAAVLIGLQLVVAKEMVYKFFVTLFYSP